jgi:hypothetical protein
MLFNYCLELNKVYGCVVGRSDHMVPKAGLLPSLFILYSLLFVGGPFNLDEYHQYPERYVSKFATEVCNHELVIVDFSRLHHMQV